MARVLQHGANLNRTPTQCGKLFDELDRSGRPFSDLEYATAYLAENTCKLTEFVITRKAGRHRHTPFAIVRFQCRGTQTNRPSFHSISQKITDGFDFSRCCPPLRRIDTHHIGSNTRMVRQRGNVEQNTPGYQHIQVISKGLEFPEYAVQQRIQRHSLDLGEVLKRKITMIWVAGCQSKATVTHHHGSHPHLG